ncbi:hypothetical protein EmuJ_001143500 [Echinococcus multilocularis]|uniref:Uncharacterized protein n=1 Tax=Echinococcus multilocularis TaxID=6211 RepID=A0A068YK46_ECHMU|nr:hypothetical protein EmuJ_001143500 [Echinococcus multilocularis]
MVITVFFFFFFFTFLHSSLPYARDHHRLPVPLLQPPNNLPSLIFTVTTKRLLTSGATIVSNTYKILIHTPPPPHPPTCRYHCGVARSVWNAIRPLTLSSRSAVNNSSKCDTLLLFTTINNSNRRPHIINSCKVKRVSLNSVLFANISSTRHRQLVIKHSCITGKVALKSRAEDVEDDVHEQEDDDANRGHMRVGDMDDDGHGQGGEDDSRMNVHLALFTSAPLIADIIIIIIIIHPFHKFTFRVSSFAPFLRQSPQLISPSACTPSMGQTMALRISPSRQTLKSILPVMYSWGTSHQLLFPSRRAASPTSDKE